MSDEKTKIRLPKPRSRREVIENNSTARIKQTAKSALAEYLDSFFNTEKCNHLILKSVAPASIQYITDRSFTDVNNPEKKKLTIVRFYEEYKQKLPAIIIADTGYTPNIDRRGLGSLSAAYMENGVWRGVFPVCSTINVSIYIITNDEATTDTLGSTIDLILGPLRNIAGGSYIESPVNINPPWFVYLPITYTASGTTKEPINDDAAQMMWYSTFDLELYYESSVEVQTDGPMYLENDAWRYPALNSLGNIIPEIVCDDTIKVTEQLNVRVLKFNPVTQFIIVDDPNIAIIDNKSLIITPKRLGKFKIKILDKEKPIVTDFSGYPAIVEKEITVTF